MTDIFGLKKGDTAPSLLYALDPVSVVLTGATVRFSMRDRSTGAVKVNRQACSIVTATGTPTVQYNWQGADTDTFGFFEGEFEITYAGGAIETFPNTSNISIRIAEDIA